MGIFLRAFFRRGNSGKRQHCYRAVPCVLSRSGSVDSDDFGNLVADTENRIERGHRLLENHRDAIAANVTHRGVVETHEIFSLEHYPAAAFDSSRRLN